MDPLIPRQILWADPTKHLAKISPDGKYISYLAPYKGNLNLWLAKVGALDEAIPVSASDHPCKDVWWSKNSDHLLYIHDHQGDENWQLFAYHLSTGQTRALSEKGQQARLLHQSNKHPETILIGVNARDKRFMDVYKADLLSGELSCIYENSTYWDFLADDDLDLRIGFKVENQGAKYVDLRQETKTILEVPLHDVSGLYFYPRLRLGLSSKYQKLYALQSNDHNTSTLSSIALDGSGHQNLFNDIQADVCDVLVCPMSAQPLAVATNYERKQWHPIDTALNRDFDYLKNIDDGDIDILSQTENNETWVVSYIHDNGPITYYLYHRLQQEMIYLFDSHDELKKQALCKMYPKVITTRDGLKCVSYLSLPREYDSAGNGIPTEPMPLVLMVHGGPNYRDFWGFNPTHQWLANRGYAVLSINYRASTGFGKDHMHKGFGEWGGKIHSDLIDAVNWAIENKITTKDKVAIMGRSFGGYATLIGLTFTPDVFCCGVDIVGPSNLETMAKHFPPYWKAMQGAIHEMIGCDPTTPEGKAYLKERSPLYYVNKISKPLLIGHGANDVRVLQEESEQMVRALKANNIPVTYAIFPDEGHQFMHPGNRMAFYALAEIFLAKVLKGRSEPFNSNIETSMIIKEDDFSLGA